jgi:orotate phosphoribosyltransferase
MDAKYYLTANGTTVIEDLIQSGNVIMTSAYHLDGSDVRVTHYCAAGNQPRLKADTSNANNKSIKFKFVDITNLKEPGSSHVTAIELKFPEKGKLVIIFTFTTSGKENIEQIQLARA